jgi:hypothetical protein
MVIRSDEAGEDDSDDIGDDIDRPWRSLSLPLSLAGM